MYSDERKKLLKGSVTGHCGHVRTTARYLIGVYDGARDWDTGRKFGGTWSFKNTCFLGNIPANGLLYNSPVYCGCLPYLRGFLAFAPPPVGGSGQPPPGGADRLEKGPAYAFALKRSSVDVRPAWNTCRHDAHRSGSTAEALPRQLKVLWSASVTTQTRTEHGKSVTPPVVAEGKVFVAAADSHQVCALDAKTGELRWRYLLDGRVEVPPTVHKGLCLFGANDGWVYCLRAADGGLLWRFRAAPRDRRIMVSGRLESPWPVPGVLVDGDVAYSAAGRHSGMGDGISAFALDPAGGKLLWKKRLKARGGDKIEGKLPWSGNAHANDVLVSADKFVLMGRLKFDPVNGRMSMAARTDEFFCSGNARSGRGLAPLGFLYDRNDVARRSSYHNMRYELTFWSYRGVKGLLLAFSGDTVFGVTGKRGGSSQWDLFARSLAGAGKDSKPGPSWSVKVPAGSVQAILPSGDTLFVAGAARDGGLLTSYSAADGRRAGALHFDDSPVFDGLAATGGRLYVSTRTGKVFCFGKK